MIQSIHLTELDHNFLPLISLYSDFVRICKEKYPIILARQRQVFEGAQHSISLFLFLFGERYGNKINFTPFDEWDKSKGEESVPLNIVFKFFFNVFFK